MLILFNILFNILKNAQVKLAMMAVSHWIHIFLKINLLWAGRGERIMDLDQYLEKMITNTKIIWIQEIFSYY